MKQDAAKVAAAAAAAQQQQQQAWGGNAAAAGPKKGLAEIQVQKGGWEERSESWGKGLLALLACLSRGCDSGRGDAPGRRGGAAEGKHGGGGGVARLSACLFAAQGQRRGAGREVRRKGMQWGRKGEISGRGVVGGRGRGVLGLCMVVVV